MIHFYLTETGINVQVAPIINRLSENALRQLRFKCLVLAGKVKNMLYARGFEPTTRLTTELLLANGWIEKPGIVVLKNPVIRLGWVLRDKTFIIGYGQLPHPVTTVEQLLDIYRVCGLDELAEKFVI